MGVQEHMVSLDKSPNEFKTHKWGKWYFTCLEQHKNYDFKYTGKYSHFEGRNNFFLIFTVPVLKAFS